MRRRGNREGTIRQRPDGRWEAAVRLEGGQRKSVYGKTRQEAARKLAEAVRAAEAGLVGSADRLTVGQYLARWLEDSVRPRVRPKTYRGYEQLVRVHIVPALGRVRLAKLGPMHVQHLMNGMLSEGLSPRTVQYARAVLRAALAQGVRWRLVAANAAALAEPPRVRRPQVPAVSPSDARVLLDALAGDRLEALYVLALGLGLRQGELLGLRWSDIDLDRGELRVRRALQKIRGEGFKLVDVKTDLSRRTLALPPTLVEVLVAHQHRQDGGDGRRWAAGRRAVWSSRRQSGLRWMGAT
jgi:integrase